MKFTIVVDLWLDGYENDEDMREACIEFIKHAMDTLDCAASSVEYDIVNIE